MRGGVLVVWVRFVGLIVSFVPIYLSQASIITRVARFLDCSGFLFYLFIVLCDIAHAVFLQLLACKEPPCDGVDVQSISHVL